MWTDMRLPFDSQQEPAIALQRLAFVQRRLSALRSVTVAESYEVREIVPTDLAWRMSRQVC